MTVALDKTPNLSVGTENLKRLCGLRCILSVIEGLAFVLPGLHYPLPLTGVMLFVAFNFILVVSTTIRLRHHKSSISHREFFLQLLLDLIAQTALLFLSGGYTNPLVSIYLITVSIGAALLPKRFSWYLALGAILFYTLLMYWYFPIGAELHHEHLHHLPQYSAINIHLVGMWVTFVVSAVLINYFVQRMASAMRNQQKAMAEARERQLRDQHILAIAIQAAGAAHELGTPLATMAIVLGDLQMDLEHSPHANDLSLLQGQIEECKKRLQQLVAESHYCCVEPLEVKAFLCRVIEQWQLVRPTSKVHYNLSSWPEGLIIRGDLTLYQAVTALLDNAEDASAGQVSLTVEQQSSRVSIQIRDKGTGLPQEHSQFGGLFFRHNKEAGCYGGSAQQSQQERRQKNSQKEGRLGIGLLLSQAGIERLGGQVRVFNQPCGGALTEILLPCFEESLRL